MFSLFVLPFCAGVVALLAISVMKYCRWIRQFTPDQHAIVRQGILSWKFIPALWEMFREGLLHWRITRHNLLLGYMHRSLAFGWFLLIVVGALQALLAYPDGHPFYVAIFFNYFEPRTPHNVGYLTAPIATAMDILLLYVFSGLTLAMFKKCWSRPMGMRRTTRHNLTDRTAKAALWCIFPFRLLAEGATSSLFGNGAFLVGATGRLIGRIGLNTPFFEYQAWTLYSLALGIFFVLMPFTRYMHIFTEILLIYFRRLGLADGEQKNGYTLFELSACSRCGLCIDGCPINRQLDITNTQGVYLLQTIRNKDLFHRAEDIAETCLVCGRCTAACPVGIDLEAIRRQVRTTHRAAIDHPQAYAPLHAVQPFNATGRVAYFGGCMSHLTPSITHAMEQIFQSAGQNYCRLDQDRTICCGRPLLQQGLVKQAEELRKINQQLIIKSKATMLVTSCPICYQTFTHDYHLPIPVLHHSQYIDILLRQGRLAVQPASLQATYHDPCELGRGCGIYEEPRRVVRAVATLLATKEERDESLCCGFNIGNTAIDAQGQAPIRNAALDNLLAPSPDIVCTACPMCKKAFTNGPATPVPVLDIAELVAQHIKA